MHPHLLYLGGVTVEESSAGPLQLYRLLGEYPRQRLCVVEADCGVSDKDRRLAGVQYLELKAMMLRGWYFARTRAPSLFWPAFHTHALLQSYRALKLIAPFKPEAVVTVHDGFAWVTAAKLAERLRVPLHLILHDDWFRNLEMAGSLETRFEGYFGRVYRAAEGRFCVSPSMESEYGRRFAAQGTVLYPIRNADSPLGRSHRRTPANAYPTLNVAYAGNIFNPGNWEALRYVAAAIEPFGGRLLLFGPTPQGEYQRNGLTAPNVIIRGFLDPSVLKRALEQEADVLFLPMSFDESDKRNMELCFPSKLADYTAAALPVLIYGPEYCSAVRWARQNPGAAEVVSIRGKQGIDSAIARLASLRLREELGRRASELGDMYFSHEAGARLFSSAISNSVNREKMPVPAGG